MRLPAILSLALAALTALACNPPAIDREEIKSRLFQDKGDFAGYSFEDTWDSIKKNPDPIFKVRDQKGFEQLRRDLSDPGSEGFFLNFGFDGDNKMTSLGASVYGSKQNAVTVRMILDDAIEHFDKQIGKGRCTQSPSDQGSSSNCDWAVPGKPRVHILYLEYKDPIRGTLDISVTPPGK